MSYLDVASSSLSPTELTEQAVVEDILTPPPFSQDIRQLFNYDFNYTFGSENELKLYIGVQKYRILKKMAIRENIHTTVTKDICLTYLQNEKNKSVYNYNLYTKSPIDNASMYRLMKSINYISFICILHNIVRVLLRHTKPGYVRRTGYNGIMIIDNTADNIFTGSEQFHLSIDQLAYIVPNLVRAMIEEYIHTTFRASKKFDVEYDYNNPVFYVDDEDNKDNDDSDIVCKYYKFIISDK